MPGGAGNVLRNMTAIGRGGRFHHGGRATMRRARH